MRIIALFAALLALAGFSFALQTVSDCQNISASDTYVLNTSISGFPNPGFSPGPSFSCIRVTASNVVLDCDGYSITGNGSYQADGVLIVGPVTNVTVQNCHISLYGEGIGAYNGTNSSFFLANELFNNTYYGLAFLNSANNLVSGNEAHDNSNYGFFNYIGSSNNTFSGNIAHHNFYDGIRIENANGNLVINNVLHDNNDGTITGGGANNTIMDNLVYNHPRSGIEVAGCDGCQVINNTVQNSSRGFFFFQSSTTNLLAANNTALYNDVNGFDIDGPVDSDFEGNTAGYNGRGYFIRADNNTFTGNSADHNDYSGIELQGAENNTLVDNIAQENGYWDLSLSPYEDADCNNTVQNLTGSGGREILYLNYFTTVVGGTYSEVALCNADGSSLLGTAADGSSSLSNNGFLLESSENVTLNGTVSSNNYAGYVLSESPGAVLDHVTATGNDYAGLAEFTFTGSASTVMRSLFSGNGWAIVQDSFNSVPFSLANSQAGNVNISITDEIGSGGGGYRINETTAPGSPPPGLVPVGNRYLKIWFTGDLGINSTTFHWSDLDVSILDGNSVKLYTWNGTGWVATPSQVLDPATNSLTVTNLLNITDDDIYGLFAALGSDGGTDGGGAGTPELSVQFETSCGGNTVTVRGDGILQSGATIKVNGTTVGTTDPSGQLSFDWNCSQSVGVEASKSGFSSASGAFDTVSCSLCAVPECTLNADCASNEVCSAAQACEPLQCPEGQSAQDHQCVMPQCTTDGDCGAGMACSGGSCVQKPPEQPECSSDGDCASDQRCSSGKCVQVSGCGIVQDHRLVPYECGSGPDCPSCPQGEACQANRCVAYSLECPASGVVGSQVSCLLKADGEPCASCAGRITDPDGQSRAFTADASGNIAFTLDKAGSFGVYLLQNGSVMKSISVKALPSGAGGEGEKPAATGPDAGTLLGLLLLVLLVVGAVLYWRSRKK